MVDELFDREYRAGRADFHIGIEALARRIRDAIAPIFIVMHRIEWNAPWDTSPGRNAQSEF